MKLTDHRDTFNFTVGPPMRLVDGYRAVRLTRREVLVGRLRQRWLSATRWFRPRRIITAIDHDAGSITMSTQRWSWLRWRWL